MYSYLCPEVSELIINLTRELFQQQPLLCMAVKVVGRMSIYFPLYYNDLKLCP